MCKYANEADVQIGSMCKYENVQMWKWDRCANEADVQIWKSTMVAFLYRVNAIRIYDETKEGII